MSLPLLMLGVFTVRQSREMAVKTDELFNQNSAISAAAAEMLAKFTEARFLAGQNDLDGFLAATAELDLLLKALAWGTDSDLLLAQDGSTLWERWRQHGWADRIGPIRTSKKIRQYSGEIALFHKGFAKYTTRAIQLRLISGDASGVDHADMEKARQYERLVVDRIKGLLDELATESRQRRRSLSDLQFDQMSRSFLLAIVFFLLVVASAWYFSYRDIARPIHDLTLQLEKVRAGDLHAKLPLGSQDEVGQLARSFNRMTEELNKATVSKDYMNAILEASPLGLMLTDEKGDTLYSNAAFLRTLGATENVAKGRSWVSLVHTEDHERVLDKWNQTLQWGAPYDDEQRLVRSDGTWVWTRVVAAPMMDAEKVTGYVLTIEDITEQKKLEGTVRQSEKMAAVGELAGGIAHDLNNGLTPVMGYLDMLLHDVPKDTQAYEILSEAKVSTQRCVDVVKKLLNFSRPSAQSKMNLDVRRLLAEFERLSHTFLPASVTVKIKCQEDVRPIHGNESDIMSVLMNLAVNARDAMDAHGTLTIEARNAVVAKDKGMKLNDGVIVTVTDTGAGIPPETLKRIFEPFFTTKPKGQGTGLGLSMVYNVLKDHEATIDVASAVGKGTTFTMYFPDPKDIVRDFITSVVSPAATSFLRGTGTVLFVDDEESMRNMGKVFLERMGYQVILAKDGEEAIQVFNERNKEITLAVLDMTMPKLSGLETMKRLKAARPDFPVVLASGFTSEGTAEELVAAGAAAFLPKPYMIGPLAETLRKVLGR